MISIATVFSGIGAFEQALIQLQIEHKIVFACDNGERYLDVDTEDIMDKLSGKSYKKIKEIIEDYYTATKKNNNVKKSYFANYNIDENSWYEDIRFLNGKKYKNKVDILVGGSPCQSFSTYGKRLGLEDTRGTLFYDFARLIDEIHPKCFIFENVTGLLNHDKGRTWEIIKNVFTSLNYEIAHDVLDARDYNLPQMRKRLFVVGIRRDIANGEKFVFPPKMELKKTTKDYLKENIDDKYYLGFKGFRYVTDHSRNEGRARVNRDIIGCQTANQQFNWTGDFRLEKPKKHHFKDQRIHVGKYLGEDMVARKLTPDECLELMGFKNFNIVVTDQVMYRQVGNSIAVPVLKEIVKQLLERIE